MKKIIYLFSVFIVTSGVSISQDIHFSAMEYSPYTLNPALTGVKHDLSATVNYRNQWNAVASPYKTIGAGADLRVNSKNADQSGALAVGINFFNDVAGLSKMATNGFGATFAYHLPLAEGHFLGMGIQGSYSQRAIEVNDGRWGHQYDGMKYDPTIPGEMLTTPSFSYFSANAGLVYSFIANNQSKYNNGTTVNIGLSAYHLNTPTYSFIQNEHERLNVRLSSFVMAQIGLYDSRVAIEPQLIAQFQGPSFEALLGTDVRAFFGEASRGNSPSTSVAFGTYWRSNDALMTRLSVRFYGVDLGFVYDFNLFNDLQSISRSNGAFEFYSRYVLDFDKITKRSNFRRPKF